MTRVIATAPLPRAVVVATWVLACLCNVVFAIFFALYTAADEWAVNRSEATGAFDPSQLFPHDVALWLIARAALGLLVVLDAVGIALFLRGHRQRVTGAR